MTTNLPEHTPPQGAQRLPLEKLHAWEALGYGMFIHFGLSTFINQECPSGEQPSTVYAPDRLDVDQWIQVARDAGMKYAVLTAKHVSGHCLWPSKHTDYHVGSSGNPTDVVEAFVTACQRHGLKAGLYYCSWDNHHRFGSVNWSDAPALTHAYTTAAYRDFQLAQVEELLTRYGPLGEVWIDIPGLLGHEGRRVQYQQIASLQPEALIMLNSGCTDGTAIRYDYAWPSDLIAIERFLPSSNRGYDPWFRIAQTFTDEQDYYLPGEVCDPIGYDWFHVEGDAPRSDGELLGMRLVARERGANLLLDVPPDPHGVIPAQHVEALMRLQKNLERFDG